MSSSLRRGAVAAVFAFSTVLALSACGAGFEAETQKIKPDNAAAQVDAIKVQNVNVILPDGTDGPAGISARIFNESTTEQVLESITLPGSGVVVELTPAGNESQVVVPARGSVALGGEGNPSAFIADPAAAQIALGNAQQLVFLLSETGAIELAATVVPASENWTYYADWGPTPPAVPADEEGEAEGDADSDADTEQTDEGATDGAEGDAADAGAEGDTGTGTDAGAPGSGVENEDGAGLTTP
ncbi:DUF461 domain-containing protein [Streptomyces xiamenensis]|uniref:Lipoprotein n=1 Tax=Streptomyces xiamenensis TaxID=408015 RepID=A0A0F7FW77_9ACTN|nr:MULTISPECIES: hypothetical protein [Streptomyces]AKG44510.1 lipoprotein [Streptomyces xiamenensis]